MAHGIWQVFASRTPLCPAEALHLMVARLCARMCTLSHTIAAARQDNAAGGGGGTGNGGGAIEGDAGGSDVSLASCKAGGESGDGKGQKTEDERQAALKADEDQLKHLRHSLLQIISGMCPHFDGMYTTPLAPHLAALLLPLLQTLEDRDQDLSRQAKRVSELSANTPMLPDKVLHQWLGSVYMLGESKSWHVRSAVLLFLQIIAFRHQFLMSNDDELARIRELMLSLLQDSQVEVRETASAAVAVLVRICGEHLAQRLSADFKAWARQAIPKGSALSAARQTPLFVSESRNSQRQRAAVARAGLALSSSSVGGGGGGLGDADAGGGGASRGLGDEGAAEGSAGCGKAAAEDEGETGDADADAGALKRAVQRRSLAAVQD